MEIQGLDHLNIRCSERDLPAIEKFYGEVVGLKPGYRPFSGPGVWLYDGERALVHVSARWSDGKLSKGEHNGSVDHIAFRVTGASEFRARVRALGIQHEEANVSGAGYQIFLSDPVGTKLEFNFANDEAPSDIAPGTRAPRNRAAS